MSRFRKGVMTKPIPMTREIIHWQHRVNEHLNFCTGREWQSGSMKTTGDITKVTCKNCRRYLRLPVAAPTYTIEDSEESACD